MLSNVNQSFSVSFQNCTPLAQLFMVHLNFSQCFLPLTILLAHLFHCLKARFFFLKRRISYLHILLSLRFKSFFHSESVRSVLVHQLTFSHNLLSFFLRFYLFMVASFNVWTFLCFTSERNKNTEEI